MKKAAVLHDTIEDTPTSMEELEDNFGAEIASLVGEVTDEKGQPRAVRRKHRIETAHTLSPGGRLVLFADKLYNCRDCLKNRPTTWSDSDVEGYLKWVAEVVRQIRGSNDILERLLADTLAQGGVTL